MFRFTNFNDLNNSIKEIKISKHVVNILRYFGTRLLVSDPTPTRVCINYECPQ